MKVESYKCDGCGKLRASDANRWWVLCKLQLGQQLPRSDQPGAPIWNLRLVAFEDRVGTPGEIHLCGEDCVQKKVSEFLGGKL